MSGRSDDSGLILFFFIVVVGVIGFGIWKFSQALGVDVDTGAKILINAIIYIIACGGASFMLKDSIGFKNIALILFPFSIFCITPLLTYKAVSGVTAYSTFPWWGTGYGHLGIFAILALISFLIWYFTKDD